VIFKSSILCSTAGEERKRSMAEEGKRERKRD